MLLSCHRPEPIPDSVLHYPDSRPYVRWWWFSQPIHKKDVRFQLNWVRQSGFGGVEIAWIYPPWRYNARIPRDTTGPKWLSQDWQDAMQYTVQVADSLGLGCDFTFGSAWPAASSDLPEKYGTKIYGDSTFRQRVSFAWNYPFKPLVLDHLDSNAFAAYRQPLNQAFSPLIRPGKSALFTDSWEIRLDFEQKIWSATFGETFHERFGYRLEPYMGRLDSLPQIRYDYMKHLHTQVLEGFYEPFVRNARKMQAISRVQCLASPTNVLTAYGLPDVPESEALLNEPAYSAIPASAACLTGRREVSAEAFTCLYGFPGTWLREENAADLKLLGDALFAHGINHLVYHGMPYQVAGDTANFFATTYIGPGTRLAEGLPELNAYFTKVSGWMKQGRTWSDAAVYFPWEDKVMAGPYPPEKRRSWVWGQYEMRDLEFPEELKGYNPLWINGDYLRQAEFSQGKLKVGEGRFSFLYLDVQYLDADALVGILRLARAGLPVILKQSPLEPGFKKDSEFGVMLEELLALQNVKNELDQVIFPPLVEILPAINTQNHEPIAMDWWARETNEGILLFLADPASAGLKYPMVPGQSFREQACQSRIKIHAFGKEIELDLEFPPYQSLLISVQRNGKADFLDISYFPPRPISKPREPQLRYF
ncbi:MAG: hypothetical protein H6581_19200 [Bacteroidia bacterium]|nr:hypothetical protein [Bacteroidia bacterium]